MSHRRRSRVAGSPPGDAGPARTSEKVGRIRPWAALASDRRVLALALAFRAANALLVRTYFNPDEHWQCLEVAHRVAFGYGHLTWEWKRGLRSYLHPLIFAAFYKILALLHLDTPWVMVMAPRLLQSVFAAFGDMYLYKLSRLIFNDQVAQWTLFAQLVNWFMFFCITRTLSNSLETVLSVAGLYYWFTAIESSKETSVVSKQHAATEQSLPSRKIALLIAALSCAIRPTSAVTWLYVGLLDFIQTKSKCRLVFLDVIPVGAIVLAVTTLLDWWMYGSRIIVPLNFLKFNFFSSGGNYYGTHVFHWYFTQGFPSMIWTFLPFAIFGIVKSREWRLSGLIAWVLGVYSILGHKEFRLLLSCHVIIQWQKSTWEKKRLIITNVPMALYMSLFHQGPWMSQIVSLQAHLSLLARFLEIYLHSVTLYYLSPKKDMLSSCFYAIPFLRSRVFSIPISRLTETFSRLLWFIHRRMRYDLELTWQKTVVSSSNNLRMFLLLKSFNTIGYSDILTP